MTQLDGRIFYLNKGICGMGKSKFSLELSKRPLSICPLTDEQKNADYQGAFLTIIKFDPYRRRPSTIADESVLATTTTTKSIITDHIKNNLEFLFVPGNPEVPPEDSWKKSCVRS